MEPQKKDRGKVRWNCWIFTTASEHLEFGTSFAWRNPAAALAVVEPLQHHLRHGSNDGVFASDLLRLKESDAGETGKVIRREKNYFENHAGRLNYKRLQTEAGRLALEPSSQHAAKANCASNLRPFWTKNGLRKPVRT